MKLKDASVVVNQNIYTEMMSAAADLAYGELGMEPVCTSGNDSTKHMKQSMHYKDRAIDLRTWDVLELLVVKIKERLPSWYEVYVESDHIHIEADEKHEPPIRRPHV